MTAPDEPIRSATETELFTVQEVCDRLQISRWTFYRLVQQRELRSVTIGRSRRVLPSAVAEYLRRLEANG